MLPRLVPVEDEEVSKELARVYRKRGINFHTSAKVDKVDKTKTGMAVTITVDGKQQKIEAEKILIAVGRKPRTENIGLERPKIKPDREFIKTDSWMQTAEPGIYAIGDIVLGTPQLAHVGAMEGICGGRQDCGQDRPSQSIPSTFPAQPTAIRRSAASALPRPKPRSRIQRESRQVPLHGQLARQYRRPARRLHQNCGDADYGEILGVHIIGPQATELIAEAVAAMELEATVEDLVWTIHAHPTLAEAMLDASNSVYGMAINA